jgi:hypothetical protein
MAELYKDFKVTVIKKSFKEGSTLETNRKISTNKEKN